MAHEYGTRSKSQVDLALHRLEENIVSSINSLGDEIINLKDIIIKKLQYTGLTRDLNKSSSVIWKEKQFNSEWHTRYHCR